MRLSVAMCTYNGEKFISEQINSIVNQTYKVDEIIICDDNSSDDTVKIVSDILSKTNINHKIICNSQSLGVTKNFEKAIKNTSGDIIFLSDQDDVWVNEKVEKIVNEFNNDQKCKLVFTDAKLVDSNRKSLNSNLWSTLNFRYEDILFENILSILLNRCIVTGATVAFKKELFLEVYPFNDSWLHDGWIAINAPILGNVKAINESLIEYRQHEKNVVGASDLNTMKKIKNYFLNIKILQNERDKRYMRYRSFFEHNKNRLDNDLLIELNNCICFWEELKSMRTMNFAQSIKIIFIHFYKGSYKSFSTGFRGAFRDFLSVIFYKMRIIK